MSVSVVDYGLGNLGSVLNMFRRIGVEASTVRTPEEIETSDRVLLPGVGAFDRGTALLHVNGLGEAARTFARSGKPVLGICLGMQLLLDSSEEGTSRGLGLIPGRSVRFESSPGLRVPHMGWNAIAPTRPDPLLSDVVHENRFYFVHSYHVVPDDPTAVLAHSRYGVDFASMIRLGNVMGAQYHPEKSHAFGMTVLRNFAAL